ncbi:MAG: hypothetical protein HXY18_12920 [Bryobacteraceae bacterium]|nr:hypothetical protein [Bryobacteraceae bacterium]
MQTPVIGLGLGCALLLAGCAGTGGTKPEIRSVFTDIRGGDCVKEIDKTDPNETPFLRCPGPAGYSLIVRQVDSGRESIEVMDPANRVHALNYQEVVTRSMSNLEGRAEWRVETKDGKPAPIALIARVQAREDTDNPEKVTRTFLAVAKVTAEEVCVTDRIDAAGQQPAEAQKLADTARTRQCAPAQPPPGSGGEAAR